MQKKNNFPNPKFKIGEIVSCQLKDRNGETIDYVFWKIHRVKPMVYEMIKLGTKENPRFGGRRGVANQFRIEYVDCHYKVRKGLNILYLSSRDSKY